MTVHQVEVRSKNAWQQPVEDKDLSAAPTSPSKGDRYIIAGTPTDAWVGHGDDIAYYDGSDWQFIGATEGQIVYVKDEDEVYAYATSWVAYPVELKNLTTAEIQQVENIGATTISAAQWALLGTHIDWTAYTPTVTSGGSMTYTPTKECKYCRIGNTILYKISLEGTSAGTASSYVDVTLPIAMNAHYNAYEGLNTITLYNGTTVKWVPCIVFDNGSGNLNIVRLVRSGEVDYALTDLKFYGLVAYQA